MNRKFHPQPLFIILHCRHLNTYYIWMCVYNVDFRTVEIILTDIRVTSKKWNSNCLEAYLFRVAS